VNMGNMKHCTTAVLLGLFLVLLAPLNSFAAKRIARFDGRGVNTATSGFATYGTGAGMANSACTLMIRNPSAHNQIYTVNYTVSSVDNPAGAGTGNATLMPSSSATSGTLTAGQEAILMWEYPAAVTGAANYTQSLQCSGSIIAEDSVAANRGYLVGSATITTFQQASTITSGGSGSLRNASPIVQQNSITVGEGAPF
jgi:hypothetical protein